MKKKEKCIVCLKELEEKGKWRPFCNKDCAEIGCFILLGPSIMKEIEIRENKNGSRDLNQRRGIIMAKKTCQFCGFEFESSIQDSFFCSDAHYKDYLAQEEAMLYRGEDEDRSEFEGFELNEQG